MRGTLIDLMDYQDAQQLAVERNDLKYEQSARDAGKQSKNVNINRLITGSLSFRLRTEMQAEYIAYMMGKLGSNHITTTMLDIIEFAMSNDQKFLSLHAGQSMNKMEEKTPAIPVAQVERTERKAPKIYTREVEEDEGEFIL